MRIVLVAVMIAATPALAAPKVTPGQWQAVTVIESASMPGMPPEALAMMKGRPTTVTYCLTPEEAEADPKKMLAADKSCTMNRFRFEGGSIDAELSCKTDQGPAVVSMKGSYTPTSYAMSSSMKSGPMTMASRVTAKRLGPCK
ncbi:DUF3617 domain-containing protein [Polymorphobacter sp.]|uniref:DUF3617 domain-containing protein n=1 Tax=Polymorphobacter sp. TaxID=1909290 RepID=UPI003F716816